MATISAQPRPSNQEFFRNADYSLQTPPMPGDRFLTRRAACAELSCSRSTFYGLIGKRAFPPPLKQGARSLWLQSWMQEYKKRLFAQSRPASGKPSVP